MNEGKLQLKSNCKSLGWLLTSCFFLLLLALSTQLGSIYAWLSGQSSASNVIQTPLISLSIIEGNSPNDLDGWTDPSGEFWDQTVPKYARFTNTGSGWVVLRVSYAESWIDDSGSILNNLGRDGSDFIPIATPQWTEEGFDNSTRWTSLGDGWIYYRYPLAPGASTPVVLDGVRFISSAPSGYETASYVLTFRAEACQYSTNPDNTNELAVWALFQKTYAENGGQLTWSTNPPAQ